MLVLACLLQSFTQAIELDLIRHAPEVQVATLRNPQVFLRRSLPIRKHLGERFAKPAHTRFPEVRHLLKLFLDHVHRITAHPGAVVIMGEKHHARFVSSWIQAQEVGRAVLGGNRVYNTSAFHRELHKSLAEGFPSLDDLGCRIPAISSDGDPAQDFIGLESR